jgi:hypothetical protein
MSLHAVRMHVENVLRAAFCIVGLLSFDEAKSSANIDQKSLYKFSKMLEQK